MRIYIYRMVIEEVAESSFRNLLIIVDGESRIESIFCVIEKW